MKNINYYNYSTLLKLNYTIRKEYEKELKHLDKLCEKSARDILYSNNRR